MKFTKMQAFGNDFIYIDAIRQRFRKLPELARFLCDRHFAVGADGMVLLCASGRGDFRMRIFNPDGTEAEMCGNALRGLGKYVYDHGLTLQKNISIETGGGLKYLELTVRDGIVAEVCADIGAPILSAGEIPVNTAKKQFIEQAVPVLDRSLPMTAISWGNPHCVVYVDSVAEWEVEKYGSVIEKMDSIFPEQVNVTFAEAVRPDHIRIREWERGVGETTGCGTGCASAVVAAVLTGRSSRHVMVEQIGGILEIEWDEITDHLRMTGPAHTVFEAEIDSPRIRKYYLREKV